MFFQDPKQKPTKTPSNAPIQPTLHQSSNPFEKKIEIPRSQKPHMEKIENGHDGIEERVSVYIQESAEWILLGVEGTLIFWVLLWSLSWHSHFCVSERLSFQSREVELLKREREKEMGIYIPTLYFMLRKK